MGSAALFKATNGEEKYKKEAVASMDKYLARLNNPKGKVLNKINILKYKYKKILILNKNL